MLDLAGVLHDNLAGRKAGISYLYCNGSLEGRKLLVIPAAAGILSQNTITTQMTRSLGSNQGHKVLVEGRYAQGKGMGHWAS